MKKVLLAIVGILVLLVVIAGVLVAVAPTSMEVQREVVINKPKAEVFQYIRVLKNQDEWGPWAQRDPNMKREYNGNDGEVGFVSSWVSETEGTGEQEIMKIVDGDRIDTELRFKDFNSKADAWLITEEESVDRTKVTWGFKSELPRPYNAMMMFMDVEGALSKDYEEGLANLKKILESK